MRIALCSGLSSEFDRDVKISDGCLSERFSTCSVEPSSECLRNGQCTLKNTFFNKIVIFFFLFERKHWILCSESGLSQKGFFSPFLPIQGGGLPKRPSWRGTVIQRDEIYIDQLTASTVKIKSQLAELAPCTYLRLLCSGTWTDWHTLINRILLENMIKLYKVNATQEFYLTFCKFFVSLIQVFCIEDASPGMEVPLVDIHHNQFERAEEGE